METFNELIELGSKGYSSLMMAKITGKEHKNIIRDIREEISILGADIGKLIFEPTNYIDKQNKYTTGCSQLLKSDTTKSGNGLNPCFSGSWFVRVATTRC